MSNKLEEKFKHDAPGLVKGVKQNLISGQFKIAVVGCGAAGVATLLAFLESFSIEINKRIKITIFEKGVIFGPGFAYQCDNNELLMNMVSSTTSIFPHQQSDFWLWMLEKGYWLGGNKVLSRSGVAPDGYISRQFFGLYLKSRLDNAIVALENLGVEIELVNLEVTNISFIRENFFNVGFAKESSKSFNSVILCIGHTAPKDHFNLKGKSQYINNPYPVNQYLELIKKDDCVGIIGGQLTAADIAVALANQGHQGPINFFTRDLNLPLARGEIKNYELKYLTHENLESLKKKYREGISIRQILKLARKDFILAGVRWNIFFKNSKIEYGTWIKSLLENDCKFLNWQNLAIGTDAIIGDYWNALSEVQKGLFMSRVHRQWMAKRVPLPVHTTLKLYSLFQMGILRHYPYLRKIDASVRNKFTASISYADRPTITTEVQCDWLINASGPARDVDCKDSLLIKNLLESGVISKNPHGGIMLDFETSLIKRSDQQKINGFYAIGHLTSGTYYFVSSLDMVSLRAKRVVKHLTEYISVSDSHEEAINHGLSEGEYAA